MVSRGMVRAAMVVGLYQLRLLMTINNSSSSIMFLWKTRPPNPNPPPPPPRRQSLRSNPRDREADAAFFVHKIDQRKPMS